MTNLLLVVALYTVVFGVDYLIYQRDKNSYQYVSRRTYALFLLSQIPVLYMFWAYFEPFYNNFWVEAFLIILLMIFMWLFSMALSREKLLVCHTSSRSERCLTPGYVHVKGAEIMFQQLCYVVVAASLIKVIGVNLFSYIAYALILVIMHTPVVLSMNKLTVKRLTLGILAISAPVFYSFTVLESLWPAVYLHSLLYVVLWLTLANWEGKGRLVSYETPKSE